MPTRILRDWTDSFKLENVSAEAERLFIRIIMKADDFGRFHAEPRLLIANCLPLVSNVTAESCQSWLNELSAADLVVLYTDKDGRKLLEINNFKQRTRQNVSKFPSPDGQLTDKCQTYDGIDGDGDGDGDGDVMDDVVEIPLTHKTPEFEQAWREWIQHRKEIRHPLKPTTAKKQIAMLSKHPPAIAVKIIMASIEAGWQGLFPERFSGTQQFNVQSKKRVIAV